MEIWLVELDARDPVTGLLARQTWASSPGLQTRPTESPPLAIYEPRVIDPGNVETHMFSPGATLGGASTARGIIRLNNADFSLDRLATLICDDGAVTVRRGIQGGRYPADFPIQQVGRCRRVRFADLVVELEWTDAQAAVFERELAGGRYGGTNTLPDGLDGSKDDLAGSAIPELWGDPGWRLPLSCCNTARLIYQVSRRAVAAISSVQDRGIDLPIESVVASLAALEAASVTPGKCQVYPGDAIRGAYVRLGSKPAGAVTCNAAEAPERQSLSRVIEAILVGPGKLPGALIDRASFDRAHSILPAPCGWYLVAGENDQSVGDAVNGLCAAGGACALPGDDGVWRLYLLREAAGEPDRWLDEHVVIREGLEIAFNTDTDGLPASRVEILYRRNFLAAEPQELAEDVPAEQAAAIAQEYRRVIVERRPDQPGHPMAQPMVIETRLKAEADAVALALRARDFYCGPVLHAVVPLHVSQAQTIRLGDLVGLRLPRFRGTGLAAGLPMIVTGRVDERVSGRVFLYMVGVANGGR